MAAVATATMPNSHKMHSTAAHSISGASILPKLMQMIAITTEIEQTIQNTLEREISTDKVGEMVMERLKPLDEVAYIRFASIYHRFQDASSFMREISKFLEEK